MALLEKLLDDEIEFMECFNDSVCLAESLFSDYDNLVALEPDKFAHIRLGQLAMLSYEYIISENPNLSNKENFKLLEGAGDLYNFGARRYGKTLITIILDILMSVVHLDGWKTIFSSYDAVHIRSILERVIPVVENHFFFKIFDVRVKRSPTYLLRFNNGLTIDGVNMNIVSKNPGCFDDKTEILTNDGWKLFKDVAKDEIVLTMNPENRQAEYKQISKKIVADYNGKLKKLQNDYTEFLLTPNHKLPIVKRNNKIETFEIQDIPYKQIYVPATCNWKGKEKKTFKLSGIVNGNKKQIKISMSSWVKFVAWYLSEGTLVVSPSVKRHYRIKFGQKNNCEDIENDFNELNLYYSKKYSEKDAIWLYQFSNKLIYNHLLKEFGRYKEKHVAQYIKDLSPTLLNIFIDTYLKGDGHVRVRGNRKPAKSIFTSVKKLADDLQEIACKAGYRANLRKQIMQCNNKDCDFYFITLCSTKNVVFQKHAIEDIYYKGKVYCVEVEPHHTILVRRNGKILWSNNSQFFGHHVKKIWIEEASFETETVHEKRVDAISELGCIERVSGMTNFTKYSPAGKVFYDLSKKHNLCNVPQYVNPMWDTKEKAKAIKKYGGESSVGFRVFIKGEVVEEGISVFDMERVRKTYLENKVIKNMEISKDTYGIFTERLVVERPKNAESISIAADIGESAPTEIAVFAKINGKYRYIYNITLHNLTDKQQYQIFKFLAQKLKANFVGLDCTDGTGRAIFRSLAGDFPKENLIWVAFNEKISVDFEKDDKDDVIMKGGKPVYKEEYVSEWSVQRLKTLFYDKHMEMPLDYKFDTQFNSVVSMQSGNRITYKCIADQDHLFQTFQVFSIMQWDTEFRLVKPMQTKEFCKTGV